MSSFKDHFSAQADSYVRHRLTYPDELFAFIASLAPAHDVAWDCGTGNGQAAHGMRRHFDRVVATDAAQRQIEHAVAGDGIEYRVATAEHSGLDDHCVDAVTVATAFHWFDAEAFAREVQRVARPGAVVAVWTYSWSEMPDAPRTVQRELVGPMLEPFWAPDVRRAWDGYGAHYFPFDEVEAPPFAIHRNWTADDFIAYASTWSAMQAYSAANGHSPYDVHGDALRKAWGEEAVPVKWPLSMRIGRCG